MSIIITIPEKFDEDSDHYFNSVEKNFYNTIVANKIENLFIAIGFLTLFFGGIILNKKSDVIYFSKDFSIELPTILILMWSLSFLFAVKGTEIFDYTIKKLGIVILQSESMRFCYVHIAIKNMKHYQANDFKHHLKKANKYLNAFFKEGDFSIELPDSKTSETSVNKLLDLISQNTTWVKFTEDSSNFQIVG